MAAQPRVKPDTSFLTKALRVLVICGCVGGGIYTAFLTSSVTGEVPMHWNSAGEVTRYGRISELWLLYGIFTPIILGLLALSFFPHVCNYPVRVTRKNAAEVYRVGEALMVWMALGTCTLLFVILHAVETIAEPNILIILGAIFLPIIIGIVATVRAAK